MFFPLQVAEGILSIGVEFKHLGVLLPEIDRLIDKVAVVVQSLCQSAVNKNELSQKNTPLNPSIHFLPLIRDQIQSRNVICSQVLGLPQDLCPVRQAQTTSLGRCPEGQMTEIPQLAPLNFKEQWFHCELSLGDQASHPSSKEAPNHPTEYWSKNWPVN